MKHFAKFMAGVLAIGLWSCSSEEPVNGGSNGSDEEGGMTAYLSVNIQDAGSAMTRAGEEDASTSIGDAPESSKDDFEFGTKESDEHAVTHARFLFFDAYGIYVTEANIWRGGAEATPDDKNNVEYMGKNTLVLKGLDDKKMPKYLLTVLNDGDGTGANDVLKPVKGITRIEDVAATVFTKIFDDTTIVTDNAGNVTKSATNFRMSTTSFIPSAEQKDAGTYDGKYNYANTLKESDFFVTPEGKDVLTDKELDALTPVEIYVERLAAKLTTVMDEIYMITQNIAGNVNNDVESGTVNGGNAGTKLWIKFDGWYVNGTETSSYLSKKIGMWESSDPFRNWNEASRYRSYWAESVGYGKTRTASNIVDEETNELPEDGYVTWNEVKKGLKVPVYTHENTNTVAAITSNGSLRKSQVTEAIFRARVYSSEECKEEEAVSLVLYNGVYYEKSQYLRYVLNSLNASKNLNFYVKNGNEFRQVSETDVTLTLREGDKFADGFSSVILTSTFGEKDKIYKIDDNSLNKEELEEADYVEASVSDLNQKLKNFNVNIPAEAYEGGRMYYSVPIQHLVALKDNTIVEGNYGVVRNHWYKIEVTDVNNLGHGVFDPNKKIFTDDENKNNFSMAAKINILSWRIVSQKVDF